MKTKVIKYGKNGKRQVVVDRDFLNMILGIVLIVSCVLLSGILQLVEARFDMKTLSKADFWIGYMIKLATGYMCFFGMYILRKLKNKRSSKFLIQRQNIKAYKTEIVKLKQISNFKNWLKNVYNYRKRVDKYQGYLLSRYEKLNTEKPEQPEEDDFAPLNFINRRKFNKAKRVYNKRNKKYQQALLQKEYLEQQLNVCDIHFKIIESYRKKDFDTVKSLQDSIKNIDEMSNYKIKYKPITYNGIFNVEILKGVKDDSIDYNERSVLLKKILPKLIFGAVSVSLLASMIPDFNKPTLSLLLMMFLNFLIMGWYMFSGSMLANTFIFNIVYVADSNRLAICDEFKEDSRLNGVEWKELEEEEYNEETTN